MPSPALHPIVPIQISSFGVEDQRPNHCLEIQVASSSAFWVNVKWLTTDQATSTIVLSATRHSALAFSTSRLRMRFNLSASFAVPLFPNTEESSESRASRLRSRSYKAGMCRRIRLGSTSSVDSGMTACVCVALQNDVCHLDTSRGKAVVICLQRQERRRRCGDSNPLASKTMREYDVQRLV